MLFGREAFRCLVLRVRKSARVGANNDEVPPVPIPNTEVKLIRADNTWREAAREDKSVPTPARRVICGLPVFAFGIARAQPSKKCTNSSVGRAADS